MVQVVDNMKKIGILALCALVMAGCSPAEKYVTVTVGLGGVVSGAMGTKAEIGAIEAALEADLPDLSGVSLIVNGSGVSNKYVKVGESVTLKEGVYRFSGENSVEEVRRVGSHAVYEVPRVIVEGDVEISEGMTEVKVPARFGCWALVLDKGELESVVIDGVTDDVLDEDGVDVLYVDEDGADVAWNLRVVPWDTERYKAVDYAVQGNVAGRWYYYSPKGRVNVGGMLGVEVPGWIQGEI